jgi:hypothetical protein
MHVKVGIPRGNQDIATRTWRKIIEEIDVGIISIIEYQQPLVMTGG